MKVVLIKNVDKLGKAGDIKNVADGFASNFLIPNQLAKPATENVIAETEKNAKERILQEKFLLQKTQEVASQIDGKELIIKAKAKEGKLFGSITPAMIAEKLKEEKIEIGENNIKIKKPIREIGEHSVKVELEHGLEGEMKVIVEEENEKTE